MSREGFGFDVAEAGTCFVEDPKVEDDCEAVERALGLHSGITGVPGVLLKPNSCGLAGCREGFVDVP